LRSTTIASLLLPFVLGRVWALLELRFEVNRFYLMFYLKIPSDILRLSFKMLKWPLKTDRNGYCFN